MGTNGHQELGVLAVLAQGEVDGRAVQGLALLAEEEGPPWGLQARTLHQPGLDGPDFVTAQGVRR